MINATDDCARNETDVSDDLSSEYTKTLRLLVIIVPIIVTFSVTYTVDFLLYRRKRQKKREALKRRKRVGMVSVRSAMLADVHDHHTSRFVQRLVSFTDRIVSTPRAIRSVVRKISQTSLPDRGNSYSTKGRIRSVASTISRSKSTESCANPYTQSIHIEPRYLTDVSTF